MHISPLLVEFEGTVLFPEGSVACWDQSRPTVAAPVAGQQLPFPGGLTFESQPARLDGRCTKRDRRREDDEGREGGRQDD